MIFFKLMTALECVVSLFSVVYLHSAIQDGGHVCGYPLGSTMCSMLVTTEQYCGEGSAL